MPYHTEADVRDVVNSLRLSQAADDQGDGQPDANKIATAIARADAECFGYVRHRYPGVDPATATPANIDQALRYKAADLAAYYLVARQGRRLTELRETVLEWLVSLRDFRVDLATDDEAVMESLTDGRRRIFRERGPFRGYGEPPPGDTDENDDNKFFERPLD